MSLKKCPNCHEESLFYYPDTEEFKCNNTDCGLIVDLKTIHDEVRQEQLKKEEIKFLKELIALNNT